MTLPPTDIPVLDRQPDSRHRTRIHVVIATTGRPAIVRDVVERLGRQTRPADGILVVGARHDDLPDVAAGGCQAELLLAPKGLCKQRNAALERLEGKSDIVTFFDDDFVPAHDFLENLEKLMDDHPEIVGATGRLVDDGAQSRPIPFGDAARRLDLDGERPGRQTVACASLYGCNMAFRLVAARGLRFDENLPLYGWQEDVDFTHQLSWRGQLVQSADLTGIHLGMRSGKTSGKRLGYSQIANIVYLWRKGTMRPWLGERLLFQNIVSNVVRSIWSERDIDRRGRLLGNIIALSDLLQGRLDPRRIDGL